MRAEDLELLARWERDHVAPFFAATPKPAPPVPRPRAVPMQVTPPAPPAPLSGLQPVETVPPPPMPAPEGGRHRAEP